MCWKRVAFQPAGLYGRPMLCLRTHVSPWSDSVRFSDEVNVQAASPKGRPQREVRRLARWIGVDRHKRSVTVAILTGDTAKAKRRRFANTDEAWSTFCHEEVGPDTHLVLEATTGAWETYDRLVSAGAAEVLVGHPFLTKAIASARVKNDRVDATTLAYLGRAGLVPAVYVPTPQERTLRSLVKRWVSLGKVVKAQKNQIHAALLRQNIACPKDDLFTLEGRRFLAQLDLPRGEEAIVAGALEVLDLVEAQRQALEAEIASLVRDGDPGFQADVARLMTFLGVDLVTAVAVRARLGDIRRFRNGRFAAAYLGLTSRVRDSGDTHRSGSITKQGDRAVRWLLCQAAWAHVRAGGQLRGFFQRLCARKGEKIAIVAVARKIAMILFGLLRTQTDYRGARPGNVLRKQRRIARLAASYWDALLAATAQADARRETLLATPCPEGARKPSQVA